MRKDSAARRNGTGAAVALLAALLSISCGGNLAQDRSTIIPADVTLNTSSIGFGSVTVGKTKNSAIMLTNSSVSGGPSITFSQVTTTGTGFSTKTAALPIVLAPGETSAITIVFTPKAAGTVSGSLSIAVDGATDPAMVPLSGTGVAAAQVGGGTPGGGTPAAAAQLTVSPATLSFGSVAVGGSKNQTGTLTAGSSSITVSSAAWSGQGYSVSGISFPVTVAAGDSVSFTVTFDPQTAGSLPGGISFVSNATDSPTVETLAGTGTQTTTTSGVQHDVNLAWDASTSTDVAGYNVYRGTQSGGPYARVNGALQTTTGYTDSSVQAGDTYYYVTTSVGTDSVESAYSGQATAVIPSP